MEVKTPQGEIVRHCFLLQSLMTLRMQRLPLQDEIGSRDLDSCKSCKGCGDVQAQPRTFCSGREAGTMQLIGDDWMSDMDGRLPNTGRRHSHASRSLPTTRRLGAVLGRACVHPMPPRCRRLSTWVLRMSRPSRHLSRKTCPACWLRRDGVSRSALEKHGYDETTA